MLNLHALQGEHDQRGQVPHDPGRLLPDNERCLMRHHRALNLPERAPRTVCSSGSLYMCNNPSLPTTQVAADILENADPNDLNDDGISGRPNVIWSIEFDQPMLGRFGLKAGSPTVMEQSAGAFAGDIGISSPLFPAGQI